MTPDECNAVNMAQYRPNGKLYYIDSVEELSEGYVAVCYGMKEGAIDYNDAVDISPHLLDDLHYKN